MRVCEGGTRNNGHVTEDLALCMGVISLSGLENDHNRVTCRDAKTCHDESVKGYKRVLVCVNGNMFFRIIFYCYPFSLDLFLVVFFLYSRAAEKPSRYHR